VKEHREGHYEQNEMKSNRGSPFVRVLRFSIEVSFSVELIRWPFTLVD